MPNVNINRRVVLVGGINLLPETKAWLAVLPSQPSTQVINAVNTFIAACKNDGNWQLLDRFWLFAQDKQANVVYSIVNPTSTTCTEVNSITWTQYQGYTGNGSNMYVNTNYIPSTSAVNLSLNNASISWYTRTDVSSATQSEWGVFTAGANTYMNTRNAINIASGGLFTNSGTLNLGGNTNSIGFYIAFKNSNANVSLYKNGSLLNSPASINTALNTLSIYISAVNNSGVASGFSAKQISLFIIGSAGINTTKLNTAVQTLKAQIGF